MIVISIQQFKKAATLVCAALRDLVAMPIRLANDGLEKTVQASLAQKIQPASCFIATMAPLGASLAGIIVSYKNLGLGDVACLGVGAYVGAGAFGVLAHKYASVWDSFFDRQDGDNSFEYFPTFRRVLTATNFSPK